MESLKEEIHELKRVISSLQDAVELLTNFEDHHGTVYWAKEIIRKCIKRLGDLYSERK